MEKNITVLCSECGYNETYRTGTNFLDSKYNLLNKKKDNCILNQVDEEDKKKILSIMKHGGELKDHYGYELYYCDNCHYLYSKFSFCIEIGNDKYVSSYKCPTCNLSLHKIDTSKMIEYKCNHCKKDSMIYIE